MNDQGRLEDIDERNVTDVFSRLKRAHKILDYAVKLIRKDPARIELIKHTHPKFRDLSGWHNTITTFLDSTDLDSYVSNRESFFDDVDKQSDECIKIAIEITRVLNDLDKGLKS